MLKLRKLVTIGLAAIMAVSAMSISAFANDISVFLNGNAVAFPDAKPFIDSNNRTQVPVRAIAEAAGCEVSWNEEARTVSLYSDNMSCDFVIGSPIATVKYLDADNSYSYSAINMDTEALIATDRTYIPAAYLAKALDMTADWDAATQTVNIRSLTEEELNKPFANDINMPAWFFAEGYSENNVPEQLAAALSKSNIVNGVGFGLDNETEYVNSVDVSDKTFKMPFNFFVNDDGNNNVYIESPVFGKCNNLAVKVETDSEPVWLTVEVRGVDENGGSFMKNTRQWHEFMVDKSVVVDFNDLDPTLKYYVVVDYADTFTPSITKVNGTISVTAY